MRAAIRWMAPMKAPGPPPTIPRRRRRFDFAVVLASMVIGLVPLSLLLSARHGRRPLHVQAHFAAHEFALRLTISWAHSNPNMRRLAAWSAPELAKSSKVVLAAWMMWRAIKGAPSAAPCSALLIQHSHSSTAQPGKPYCVNLEKMAAKSTWPSPRERNLPARSIQD